ncbi:MAG: sporulation protein YabP [Bacilli bacterium]|nr:sporulation protein YabP [Bacilli bacterium]
MKDIETMSSLTHAITINERKSIIITGVKKIDNFDEEEFFLETTMGNLIIKGEDLEIVKLDTYQGNVTIKGTVNSLNYTDEGKKIKENSIFNKLFK